MNGNDRQVLRDLAKQVADIAALPIQQQRAKMWRDFNSLRPQRPMVLAFPEGGWADIKAGVTFQCQSEPALGWEEYLRLIILRHELICDDHPILPHFDVYPAVEAGDYGLAEVVHRSEERGSMNWDAPVKTEADLDKLHFRRITFDREATQRSVELANEVLGDILPVRAYGALWWTCGLTWTLIRLRGLQQMMMDMYDNPALLHRLMGFLRDAMMHELDFYESQGLLWQNNEPDGYVGSGGLGGADDLPTAHRPRQVKLKDMWCLGESQEFVGVGPEQFNEFALQYQLPILKRFGLVAYGCCEPLDHKFDLIIDNIPNLRRVSVSPWCDRRIAAQKLTGRYIYSWKPNPAMICAPIVDWDHVRRVTRETLDIAKGCCLEIVMKDTHTFCGDRTRIAKWSRMVHEMATGQA